MGVDFEVLILSWCLLEDGVRFSKCLLDFLRASSSSRILCARSVEKVGNYCFMLVPTSIFIGIKDEWQHCKSSSRIETYMETAKSQTVEAKGAQDHKGFVGTPQKAGTDHQYRWFCWNSHCKVQYSRHMRMPRLWLSVRFSHSNFREPWKYGDLCRKTIFSSRRTN